MYDPLGFSPQENWPYMGIYWLSRGTAFYSFSSIIRLGTNENAATQPRMKTPLSLQLMLHGFCFLGASPWMMNLINFGAGEICWVSLMRLIFSIQIPGQLALVCSMGKILSQCKHLGTYGSLVTGRPGEKWRQWSFIPLYVVGKCLTLEARESSNPPWQAARLSGWKLYQNALETTLWGDWLGWGHQSFFKGSDSLFPRGYCWFGCWLKLSTHRSLLSWRFPPQRQILPQ